MALRLLKCTLEKIVKHLQVFSDSSLLIRWINGTGQLLNISLKPVGDQLKAVANSFLMISFTHVFKEQNVIADALSNEGQQLDEGKLYRKKTEMERYPSLNPSFKLSLLEFSY
jgi:hypothetical protein